MVKAVGEDVDDATPEQSKKVEMAKPEELGAVEAPVEAKEPEPRMASFDEQRSNSTSEATASADEQNQEASSAGAPSEEAKAKPDADTDLGHCYKVIVAGAGAQGEKPLELSAVEAAIEKGLTNARSWNPPPPKMEMAFCESSLDEKNVLFKVITEWEMGETIIEQIANELPSHVFDVEWINPEGKTGTYKENG